MIAISGFFISVTYFKITPKKTNANVFASKRQLSAIETPMHSEIKTTVS